MDVAGRGAILLEIMAGLTTPDAGTCHVLGIHPRVRFLSCSAESHLIPGSLRENLTFGAPHEPTAEILGKLCTRIGFCQAIIGNDFDKWADVDVQRIPYAVDELHEVLCVATVRAVLQHPTVLMLDGIGEAMPKEAQQKLLDFVHSWLDGSLDGLTHPSDIEACPPEERTLVIRATDPLLQLFLKESNDLVLAFKSASEATLRRKADAFALGHAEACEEWNKMWRQDNQSPRAMSDEALTA